MAHVLHPGPIISGFGMILALVFSVLTAGPAGAQGPAGLPSGPSGTDDQVLDVRVVGNRTIPTSRIQSHLQTRSDRPFDLDSVKRDVRKLARLGWFIDVKPLFEMAPGGRVVIFQVKERPTLRWVTYLGNSKIKDKTLNEQTGLKVGYAVDPYAVEEGRRKIEEYYRERGFNRVIVEIFEGHHPGDLGATYVINEGQAERIWKVDFRGNRIATDGRLKTKIQSKPGFLRLFRGYVDRKQIDEDVDRLTDYYRSLGFYRARVGRILEFDEKGKWLTLTFIIDEGPRYVVRKVAFLGNEKFSDEALAQGMNLQSGAYFSRADMNRDMATLRDMYGSQGHVFADVKVEPFFYEQPGNLDLIYNIQEGQRYRVGHIEVRIDGENPHTRVHTVLNRLSIRTGQVVDIRKIRDSERRLRYSQLFMNNPVQGKVPRIVFNPPDLEDSQLARPPRKRGRYRGQSPDVDLTLRVEVERIPKEEPHFDGRSVKRPMAAPPMRPSPVGSYRAANPPRMRGQSPGYQTGMPNAAYGSQRMGLMEPSSQPRRPALQQPALQQPAPQQPAPQQQASRVRTGQLPPGPRSSPPNLGRYGSGQPFQAPAPSGPPVPTSVSPPVRGDAYPSTRTPPGGSPNVPFGSPPAANGAAPMYANGMPPQANGQYGVLPGPGYEPLITGPNDPLLDFTVRVDEAQTGRFMVGVGVNSDAGVIGSIVVDERNFDFWRWPTGFEDFRNGTAWRGRGQRFRLELLPGSVVQRYMVNFQEPYFLDMPISLGLSGFFYDRRYFDWDEERLGGRVAIGYQWTDRDLSLTTAYRGENVNIRNPRTLSVPELAEVVGDNELHGFKVSVRHDTRDSAFLATSGHLFELELEQVVGSYEYPRATIDVREYFMVYERPDGSGRHVMSVGLRSGFSGSNTPLYDHFFAGGFSTLRGFDFRGASPRKSGIFVGGEFMLLGGLEYLFPITADDMLRGLLFCDFGTVEEDVQINDFRVAPGFGLRVTVPAMGPAPIALDFAFPVARAASDDIRIFTFHVGFLR